MSEAIARHLVEFDPALVDWATGKTDFVHGLPPQLALQISDNQLVKLLQEKLGHEVWASLLDQAQQPKGEEQKTPGRSLPHSTDWIKQTKMVGINVRTIGSFWNILKYQLCLPAHIESIHLLPIWEPGVVSSLYGMASWRINSEFFSRELYNQQTELDTAEKQLKFVIGVLHALGRMVGMDVIPHTDRYSEMVLANPSYFEWLRREDVHILDHSDKLYRRVEEAIVMWLQFAGTADGSPTPMDPKLFFSVQTEEERLSVLFGGDAHRRLGLIDHLYRLGLEPVPATMAPPYRGLEVDPNPEAATIDEAGRLWRDYRITNPTEMSRVFGPLARYQLYERKNENQDWEIDFDRPKTAVWDYVARHYARVQSIYGFDFMRGDMSHVQMRPDGPPKEPPVYYDLLAYVKVYIQKQAPHFGYFAESFLAPDNYMSYGSEVDHLLASKAEVALGNLQSTVPGSEVFLSELANYRSIADAQSLKPCFTVITSDKDDPRFDRFYTHALSARLFMAILLTDWPAYYSLGVEQRDPKYYPWPNEYYTKLYVFHLESGPKSRHGPYRWGGNRSLFDQLDSLNRFVSNNWKKLRVKKTSWLIAPTPDNGYALLVWMIGEDYICAVNFGKEPAGYHGKWPTATDGKWEMVYALDKHPEDDLSIQADGQVSLPLIEGGAGVVWARTG
ncbi:MAG: hypothetical protein AAGF87_06650 [Bacteroidota bacterium]